MDVGLFLGAFILKSPAVNEPVLPLCDSLFSIFYAFAAFMLSTQLNYMAEENRLAPNCICVLKRHVTNILKDGRYAVFLYISYLSYPDFAYSLHKCVDNCEHI